MSENSAIEWTDRKRRYGPLPHLPRNGDKKQARQCVNVEVRTGHRPHPNTLPCVDCGHVYMSGERRHEYDHHKGYAAEHHLDVEPVCTLCHVKRDSARAAKTHYIHGHEFTAANTYIASNGTRHCKSCAQARQKTRLPRGSEFWTKVNAKRQGKHHE